MVTPLASGYACVSCPVSRYKYMYMEAISIDEFIENELMYDSCQENWEFFISGLDVKLQLSTVNTYLNILKMLMKMPIPRGQLYLRSFLLILYKACLETHQDPIS